MTFLSRLTDCRVTIYQYDLTGLWAPNGDLITFLRDAGGRLTEKWLQGGSAGGASSRYQYNPDNTLQQVQNRAPGGAILSQHDYTYDGAGNRATHAEQINGVSTNYSYTYDELGRLTGAGNGSQSESYAYDPFNNRTQKTAGAATLAYVYDAANQLREIRQNSPTGPLLASLGYDANGNLTGKTEGATATTLTYDTLNRLTQVSKTGLPTQGYQYDDQGRRIGKTVGTTSTRYLYNGPDILGEYSTWTTPAASYVHGPNTDNPLIRFTATAAQYYHQDGLGSVVAVSGASGAPSGSSRYDAWGNRIAASGTVPQYGYTGREPDETGLVYYRARHYDPTIGRFTQRDPIGLRGGINPYAYVNNNPVNFTDPLGLTPQNPSNTANMIACAPVCAGLGVLPPPPGSQGLNQQKPGNEGYESPGPQAGTPPFISPSVDKAIGNYVGGAAEGIKTLITNPGQAWQNFQQNVFGGPLFNESKTPEQILMPDGKPIGQPGTTPGIREMPGGAQGAQDLFDQLSKEPLINSRRKLR